MIRDLFSDRFDALRIDNRGVYNEVVEYVKSVDPDLMDRVRAEGFEDKAILIEKLTAFLAKHQAARQRAQPEKFLWAPGKK